ncbi:MAG: carbohydrate-binding domain-containing protein [Oscillospiraceae bacterium]|nr:carbohydrate-binding domain-containing protein [Oscillospiraceae bacterium]
MSTHRHIDAICVAVLIITLLITILFMNGEALGIRVIVDEDAEEHGGELWFTANDRNGAWDTGGATVIKLNGDSALVSGGGAYAYGRNVMITSSGKYVLSGTLNDGCIVVDSDNSAKVWIMLNGVDLSCSDGPCLDVEQADKVFLTLADGTENSMTTTGFSPEAQEAGKDGTLFARDDLTLNGTGRLSVAAPEAHGIVGNDEMVIAGGNITVTAALDALHANDGLNLAEATLLLTAGDDGIAVTGTGSTFYMESGTVTVTAEDKSVNAGNAIRILGGTLAVSAGDDAISAAGEISIEDGEITIRAGDDGIHSDTALAIAGGTVLIPECYEGMEAVTIDISGGEVAIYPADDGLNANGGNSGFGNFGGGMPGFGSGGAGNPPEGMEKPDFAGGGMPVPPQGMESGTRPDQNETDKAGTADAVEAAGNEGTWIRVSGGSVTIVNDTARDADGFDSNGDIIISGGDIRISLVNSGSNSALDYGSESGGVMEISGGTVIACGSYAMAEGFDSTSTQCAILYNIKRGVAAGKTFSLEDSEGNVLLSYEVPCSFSSVILSSPELKLGETYTVVIGDTAEEITLNEVSASYGDVQSEGFGGNMNWGDGMQFRPHRAHPFTNPPETEEP